GGHEIGQGRIGVATVGERRPAAQEQQSAAAAVDEIVDELLLRRREVVGLYAADDQSLEREQVLGFGREALLEVLLPHAGRELPVELVLRGADDGGQLDVRVVVERAPYELVLPPRLALEVQNARLAIFHVDLAPD